MNSYNVPNVGVMASSGLTQAQMQIIWQNLTMQCLGIIPGTPGAGSYSPVRIDWPTPGQPAWAIADDIAFLRAVEIPDEYNTAHEVQPLTTDTPTYPETTIYTRVWQLDFIFYGPNSFDRARQVKDCLFQDFLRDTLALSNIYLDREIGTPRRTPELFQNQWWERSGFSARMNEQVNDTLTKQTIQSVEIITQIPSGIISDVTFEL